MIYFTNTTLTSKHLAFIGRWSPFHKGHVAIIQKKRKERPTLPVLIMVRDTDTDAYPAYIRAAYIKTWVLKHHIKATIMIIPNIEGIYWGRDVGYSVGLVDVDRKLQKISGTDIRKNIFQNAKGWKQAVANPQSSQLLSPKISTIIEHGLVIWLTGCPSSGKTTIANALLSHVHTMYPYLKIQLLDGDAMRASPMAQHVGFSAKDRAQHILRMAYLAKMFADHGILTVCAFVSPDRSIRKQVKDLIGPKRFIEIYVQAKKSTRMKRDVKGMYKQAIAGTIKNLTGYNGLYQAPIRPNILCKTDIETVDQSVAKVLRYVFYRT